MGSVGDLAGFSGSWILGSCLGEVPPVIMDLLLFLCPPPHHGWLPSLATPTLVLEYYRAAKKIIEYYRAAKKIINLGAAKVFFAAILRFFLHLYSLFRVFILIFSRRRRQ